MEKKLAPKTVHFRSLYRINETQCQVPLIRHTDSGQREWHPDVKVCENWGTVTCKRCLESHPTKPYSRKNKRRLLPKPAPVRHLKRGDSESLCGQSEWNKQITLTTRPTAVTCKLCLNALPKLKTGDKLKNKKRVRQKIDRKLEISGTCRISPNTGYCHSHGVNHYEYAKEIGKEVIYLPSYKAPDTELPN